MSQACFFSGEVKVTILDVLGPGYIITFMFVAMDVATTPGDMLAPLGWCTRNGAVCGGRFCGGFYVFFLWNFYGLFIFHRIGWWDNLQECPIFDGKNHGFRLRFSLKPIQWIFLQRFIRMFKPLGILPLKKHIFFAVFFSLYLAVGIEKNLSI